MSDSGHYWCHLDWWTTPGRVEHLCNLRFDHTGDHRCCCGEQLPDQYDGKDQP